MTDALFHRGPDEGGIYQDKSVFLGHRRLSIVDLAYGVQPMVDKRTGLALVYNGEIYNHLELRRELEKLGYEFQTSHSDTETLLQAFAKWGPECFIKFNAMFACAFYSPKERKIWLARDRFGEKPLFYISNQNGFAFASEMGCLKLWAGFENIPDEGNIQRFFSWNYLPANSTIYKNCKSLPPGSWLCHNLKTNETVISRYWEFTLDPEASFLKTDEAELAEELRRLIITAVKRRLLADVPLGIFLSGGIDSSAIAAAAAKLHDAGELRTFTIGFTEKTYNEADKAAMVAKYLGVRNDVEYLTESVMQNSISPILSHMSEPFGDASLVPASKLAGFAARHVKVALSGDGGDELFGGYDPLDALDPARLYRNLMPRWLHGQLESFFSIIPGSDKNMSLEFKIRRFLKGVGWDPPLWIPVWMSGLDPYQISEFFYNHLQADQLYAAAIKLYRKYPALDLLSLALLFFTRIYLVDDILVKSDRASMMHSLETRAVFLDNDLVEFCRRLPNKFKYRNGKRKYLLKKALSGWLPEDILKQPKKGFGIPLNRWLRSLPEVYPDIPGLKPGVLEYCNTQHKKRKGDFRYFLWDVQAFAHL